MSLLSRFFPPPEVKASRALATHISRLPQAAWSPHNYESFAREGYKLNVVAYQAVNKIADAIGGMRWAVFDSSGKQLKTHAFLSLLENPNPMQSSREWWRAKTAHLLLSGNSFDERVMRGKRPIELWTLRPQKIKIEPAQNGMVKAYVYKHNGTEVTFPMNPITGDGDIRHTKLFDPLNDWYGSSPMGPASYAVDQHNEAMNWLQALLQNSAQPSGALTLDKDTLLSEDQFNRLREEIENNFAGARNAGRPMLLEGGMDWKSMSLTPRDMAIIDLKDSAARDISLAFGVPPLLLNIPGDNTFANYREARLGFYEDTVIPLVDLQTAELNAWLSPYFDGARIAPDYDSIEAIAEKRRGLWEMVDSSDEITVNEARALKGYPPIPDPLGSMLMADLRASRRGHTSDRSNAAENMLNEVAYGTE